MKRELTPEQAGKLINDIMSTKTFYIVESYRHFDVTPILSTECIVDGDVLVRTAHATADDGRTLPKVIDNTEFATYYKWFTDEELAYKSLESEVRISADFVKEDFDKAEARQDAWFAAQAKIEAREVSGEMVNNIREAIAV